MERRIFLVIVVLVLLVSFCSCSTNNTVDEEESASAIVTDKTETEDDNMEQQNNSQNGNANQQQQQSTQGSQQTPENQKPVDKVETNQTKPEDEKENTNQTPGYDDSETTEEETDGFAIDEQFGIYQSNTFVSTGAHILLSESKETTKTFRGVFPVQEYGNLEYCFYFSNNVDSTWGSGDEGYRDMPVEDFEILSASIMTTKTEEATAVMNRTKLTFNGESSKSVSAYEMFWSDPVNLNVKEGEYLVFEWKIKYTQIPAINSNGTGIFRESTDGRTFTKSEKGIPMPSKIGAKRGKKEIVFIGDSITAGEQAGLFQGYVAQVSKQLGADVSVWNIGLGWARADDAANSPAWLKKARSASNLCICFGVNDLNTGAYVLGPQTAEQVMEDIKYISDEVKKEGGNVIIFSTPPYTYASADRIDNWKSLVKSLEIFSNRNSYPFFDFASYLGSTDDPSKPAYGGHPNSTGCKIVADAFVNAYKRGEFAIK